jgi:hypothetical protein
VIVAGIGGNSHPTGTHLGQPGRRGPSCANHQRACPGEDPARVGRSGRVPEGELHAAVEALITASFNLPSDIIERVSASHANGV